MSFNTRFCNLGHPNRIWTISAVNGRLEKLQAVHDMLWNKFQSGDKVVYTGNYLCGPNAAPKETLDEILLFGKHLQTIGSVISDDVVYLRGIQEELFSKILQLQFAQMPEGIVDWIQRTHPEMDAALRAYDSSLDEVSRSSREGILSLTRWSAALKARIREHDGHENFMGILRRAAFTENKTSNDNNVLFVHAGINPHLPLISQGDSFWWESKNFNAIHNRYEPFGTIIRGYDPFNKGLHVGKVTVSLDGGIDKDAKLICAQVADTGKVVEILSA